MIARIVIPLLILIVLSDFYIDWHFFRNRYHIKQWQRMLWWVPTALMIIYTIGMASLPSFTPENLTWQNTYLILLGLFVFPKVIFAILSLVGHFVLRYVIHTKRNWGHYLGVLLAIVMTGTYLYGFVFGIKKVVTRHIDLTFQHLPPAFDGYKIVQISDMHIGTFDGWRKKILLKELDSIEAAKPDLICFVGDLENVRAEELKPFISLLNKRLPHVVAVRGNHDYGDYLLHASKAEKQVQIAKLQTFIEDSLHWRLLKNEHIVLRKKYMREGITTTDSIYLVGTENDPKNESILNISDYNKATKGIPHGAFSIMLQHDPSAWKRSVLPKTTTALTLSGHTHGGQMQFLGIRPTNLLGREDKGLYDQEGRYLYVTAGLGGVVPMRINMPSEITVITLHTVNSSK